MIGTGPSPFPRSLPSSDTGESLLNFSNPASSALSLLGFGLAGIAATACFLRATAGTRPCVRKHSVRAFHPSAHARILSALSATERRLAVAGCDNVVVVGRRPTTRQIKGSVRIEAFWFGRIASGKQLRISLQMALGLRENFVSASGTS